MGIDTNKFGAFFVFLVFLCVFVARCEEKYMCRSIFSKPERLSCASRQHAYHRVHAEVALSWQQFRWRYPPPAPFDRRGGVCRDGAPPFDRRAAHPTIDCAVDVELIDSVGASSFTTAVVQHVVPQRRPRPRLQRICIVGVVVTKPPVVGPIILRLELARKKKIARGRRRGVESSSTGGGGRFGFAGGVDGSACTALGSRWSSCSPSTSVPSVSLSPSPPSSAQSSR